MDDTTEFFENEVKGRFRSWKPGGALVKDWLEWLRQFDYDVALKSIKQCAFETKLTYPVLKKFYAQAKSYQTDRYPTHDGVHATPDNRLPATEEFKIAVLQKLADGGSEFAQRMLKAKQLDPVKALADDLSEGNYRERNEGCLT